MEASHEPMATNIKRAGSEPFDGNTGEVVRDDGGEGVGAMLRKRRIALGLSQSDVANVVKLPARRIEAMEQERWDELPDGPYLRGFLKNIARALNLDAATLIDRVDKSLMRARNPDSILVAPGSTHTMLPSRSGPAEGRYSGKALVFGALVFALIAALIAWSGTESFDRAVAAGKSWLNARSGRVAGSPAAGSAVIPAKAGESQTTSESIPSPLSGTTLAPGSSTAGDASPQTDATSRGTSVSPSAASSVNVAMQFHFREDAWVEVRGADGKLLLWQLNAAGTDQSIEGDAPFSVVIGNASSVSLSYRGQPVDLVPLIHDQVARFTLS